MIYLYDNAIVEDLNRSFNPENVPNPVVKVIPPEDMIALSAQAQEDKLSYPLVAVTRDDSVQVDNNRTNFTFMHSGVASSFDPETNNFYNERCIPIQLKYNLVIITTNMYDRDELVKELLFKYTRMYFLKIHLPYETDRSIRFGVIIDKDDEIAYSDSTSSYLNEGKLYVTAIPIKCEGCVLVSYTGVVLKQHENQIEILDPKKN